MSARDLTGLRGRDRGQTTQDFAVGISVFLLTVTFTFAFVPSTVTPFGSPVTDAIPAKSDRVAATVVDTYAEDGSARTLDLDEMVGEVIGSSDSGVTVSGTDIRNEFGLRTTAQVNVTIQTRSGDVVETNYDGGTYRLTGGDDYPSNQAAASTTRVIRLPGVDDCKTGCLLVVRVW
ncbi:DUF7287 family protein [Halorubellus litoreus]|uniref:Flagellin N-terminal-like domain-containing protein n=1 Tax=Halorubellus litoreus TaxID=755308 RepID=A0ABD5VM80_9EURY